MEPATQTQTALVAAAKSLAETLKDRKVRVVFAESCTAGLVSATLARFPGISEFHCGSAVTYRNDTKRQWISVEPKVLDEAGAVSEIVAKQMAAGVLASTPEADVAASVTGHLGPNAPGDLDGVIFVGGCRRGEEPSAAMHKLSANFPQDMIRLERQYLAATRVLEAVCSLLKTGCSK